MCDLTLSSTGYTKLLYIFLGFFFVCIKCILSEYKCSYLSKIKSDHKLVNGRVLSDFNLYKSLKNISLFEILLVCTPHYSSS